MSQIIIPDEIADAWAHLLVAWRSFGPYIMKRPLPFKMKFGDPRYTATCSAVDITCGAEFMASLSIVEQVVVILHEAIHDIRGDVAWLRRVRAAGMVGALPFNMRVAQHTCDYIVNDNLVRMGCQQPVCGWLHNTAIGTWLDDRETVYERLYHTNPPEKPECRPINPDPQPGEGQEQVDGEDDPVRGPLAAEVYRNLDPRKLRGVGPGDMERIIGALVPTGVDWRKVIRMMIRTATGHTRATWATRNAGALSLGHVLPGRVGLRAGKIVIGVDTSGSMSQAEIDSGLSGVKEILRQCCPKEIWLLDVDAWVHRPKLIKRLHDLKTVAGMKGGGGTDMRSIFRWIEDQQLKPDLVIVFTDMGTSFPKQTPCDTVWVSTRPGRPAPACAGRTVFMGAR